MFAGRKEYLGDISCAAGKSRVGIVYSGFARSRTSSIGVQRYDWMDGLRIMDYEIAFPQWEIENVLS